MSRAAVLLAPGFEEIEAVTVIDVLRRAEIPTAVLSVHDLDVVGAHGITVRADRRLADAGGPFELVVLPGGMPGSRHLATDPSVQRFLLDAHAAGSHLAAICAAPMALGRAGLLAGIPATAYPGFEVELVGAEVVAAPVVVTDRVTTSRGVGTALPFALALVTRLAGADLARTLATRMLVEPA